MPLSPDSRVLSGDGIEQRGTATRDIVAVVTATRTVGIGPDELEFPEPGVILLSPGFGRIAFRILEGNIDAWLSPVFVQLSLEAVAVPLRRVDLISVALIPANGCEMDVTTFRN